MTIKRRLFLSNLMMILVPVLIAVMVGSACLSLVFEVLKHGTSFGLEDSGEFYWASQGAVELVEQYLEESSGGNIGDAEETDTLETLLDTGFMRMEITENGRLVYAYGEEEPEDRKLIQAAQLLDETGSVASSGNRSIFQAIETEGEREYRIFVLGTQTEGIGDNLETAVIFSAGLLAASVFLAVWITNRILIKFVFRKIEDPLNALITGVVEIGKGNLEYRLSHDKNDEFRPVCEAFNEMALRLKTSVEQTKRNEESRKELMAGISHDLRSPLTSIQAYVEGLLDGIAETPEAKRSYLMTIRRKAEDIDRMVSQIFMFSKLELDEYPMQLQEVRLDTEIACFMSESAEEYAGRGLILSCGRLDPCTASVHPESLRRVLRNVADNSAKYKSKKTGHLTAELIFSGGFCELNLTDDGTGVEEDALCRLFDVFYRTDPARRNPAGGSGLGLAIAAGMLKRMGGSICAKNAPAGGLSVIITLSGKENSTCKIS